MDFIYFLISMAFVAVAWFIGVMWYDRKHQYNW